MGIDNEDLLRFEAGAHENGVAWWSARWLMELLGYSTWVSFKNVLTHALSSCMSLGLDVSENFLPYRREHAGRTEEDFRLSRFACFLIANHADGRATVFRMDGPAVTSTDLIPAGTGWTVTPLQD